MCWEAHGIQYTSIIHMKRSHWALNIVSKEAMKWGVFSHSNGWVLLVQNTDAKERRSAEKHPLFEKCVFWVFLEFWKRVVLEKPFVNLTYNLVFEEVPLS